MSIHLAVDLGASQGRVVLGEFDRGLMRLHEVHRFENRPLTLADGLHWNIERIVDDVTEGLLAGVRQSSASPVTVGIDAWGVDYGLLDAEGALLGPPFHYRDARTTVAVERVHAVVAPAELNAMSGVQVLPINTVYQLAAEVPDGPIARARSLLLIPDLLTCLLTSVQGAEITNASTTGLFDVVRRQWCDDLIARLSYNRRLFPAVIEPGTTAGSVRSDVGGGELAGVSVVRVASHDTASAVAAVPALTDDWAFISCGTWSLVGVELTRPVMSEASRTANFSNELGVDGTVRYLRNVAGLWLLQESLREWAMEGRRWRVEELVEAASLLPDRGPIIDPDDPCLLPPGDMPARVRRLCDESHQPPRDGDAALARCILDSLAAKFARTLDEAESLSGQRIRTVHVVGGGAADSLLCQLTADAAGRPVIAGPVEATAIGNLLIQARAAGSAPGDLAALRALVAASCELREYRPRPRRHEA